MKLSHTVAIVISAAFSVSSCKTEGEKIELCDNFKSEFAIKDRMGQAVSIFTAGENITFEASVTNISGSSQKLTNSDGCQHVFIQVGNSATPETWNSATGIFCTQAVTDISYASGETVSFTAQWNQSLSDNTQAPVGQYSAKLIDRTQCSTTLNKSASFQLQ